MHESSRDGNREKGDAIKRHLRRMRRELAGSEPTPSPQALAGWGSWSPVMQVAAQSLEGQWTQMTKRQHLSRHQALSCQDRARALYDIASRRVDYLENLESTPREQAGEALRSELGGLTEVDPSLEPVAFYDAEVRAAEVVLHV